MFVRRDDSVARASRAGVFFKRVKHIYLLLLLVCMVITQGGCANRNARSAKPYNTVPHVYPATRYAVRGGVARQWVARMPPGKSSGYWLLPEDFGRILVRDIFVWTVGYAYSIVIELPVSLVVDTMLLPKDMRRVKAFAAGEDLFAVALLGDKWPVPAETLRDHYHWKNCDPLINRLLQSRQTSCRREKIMCLIEAGAGLEYIAAIDDLDAEMAARLMDQVAVEHPARFGTLNTLAGNPRTPAGVMLSIIKGGPYGNWSPSPIERLISNPSVTPEVLDALADAIQKPSLLVRVARHKSTSPATLARIAQRNIAAVNRVIADNPSIDLKTLESLATLSPGDAELDAALATNPVTPSGILHRIVKRVSDPLLGKYILRDVSLHAAATEETLEIVLEACDKLEQHPVAPDVKEIIDEARNNASKRLRRE